MWSNTTALNYYVIIMFIIILRGVYFVHLHTWEGQIIRNSFQYNAVLYNNTHWKTEMTATSAEQQLQLKLHLMIYFKAG